MKKIGLIILTITILLCGMVTGCSREDTDPVFGDAIPEKITSIEVSGFYNGSDLEPWELTQEQTEELNTWLAELSLKHRTYAEEETPNKIYSGGTSYQFHINDGELTFTWVCIDKAYIWYNDEWYEITNDQTPPLGLDS